jgi:hypothetical protein
MEIDLIYRLVVHGCLSHGNKIEYLHCQVSDLFGEGAPRNYFPDVRQVAVAVMMIMPMAGAILMFMVMVMIMIMLVRMFMTMFVYMFMFMFMPVFMVIALPVAVQMTRVSDFPLIGKDRNPGARNTVPLVAGDIEPPTPDIQFLQSGDQGVTADAQVYHGPEVHVTTDP